MRPVPLLLLAACGSTPVTSTPDAPPTTAPSCAETIAALTSANAGGFPSDMDQRAELLDAGGTLGDVDTTYFAAWLPDGWSARADRRLMVALHGTDGRPEYEWSAWRPALEAHGIAYLGLSYRAEDGTYATDLEIADWIDQLWVSLDDACDLDGATTFLLGFSRGSAQAFPVTYRDLRGAHHFAGTIYDSGAWIAGEPMPPTLANAEADGFTGSRGWMWCGTLDDTHPTPMCDEMAMARTYVEDHGGVIDDLYITDGADHADLPFTPEAVDAAMAFVESL